MRQNEGDKLLSYYLKEYAIEIERESEVDFYLDGKSRNEQYSVHKGKLNDMQQKLNLTLDVDGVDQYWKWFYIHKENKVLRRKDAHSTHDVYYLILKN